ncbi:MAG TPA: family 78 glycoside hydrolase catalytic domain [Dysgonamonadaceae bacterium]|nr:family 78 glycoside hydrolase catalytic domain [Dysgonamonadaceae bacterium]
MNTTKFSFNLPILLVFFMLSIISCTKSDSLLISDTQCNNLYDPIGINTLKPSFRWKNTSSRQGASQAAYQVIVASDVKKLNESKADFWDSGKIESSQSIAVDYQGKPLSSGQLLYWKVRTWDENGNASRWSELSKFSIGLLKQEDWKASYIGFPSEEGFYSCPQMRKPFFIDKKDSKETFFLHVNSLGYHEIYINGQKANEDVLSPAVSQFNKRSLVITYDLTNFVKEGENDLVIWLGSGWYTEGLPGVIGDRPLVKAQLERVSADAQDVVLKTDESWLGRDSEYTLISDWRSGRYGGEAVKGNLAKQNIVFENPDELVWENVEITEVPEHEVSPQMVEPNRIIETIQPVEVRQLEDKAFLVDMGKNLAGWFEITFTGLSESQEVVMEYSDHLDDEGQIVNQGQKDYYIASGSGQEVFNNKFNYHGFRYVKISNLDKSPELSSMKAHLIHTDFESTSHFECSDPELNRIHDMIFYTMRCLSLGGYLVDCPQIERLGYGGDGNASTITAQTMFNMAPLYNNWLQAWSDVIREDGSMPHTAPNPYRAGGGPYWCGFIISASWNTYQNYGDVEILEKYYPVMQKWLEYVEKYTVDGLLKRWPDTDYRSWYLGDWATPEGIDQTNEKSVDLVNNCYISVCFDQMSKIAQVLGKTESSQEYLKRKDELNKIIHETFFDESNVLYGTGSQIDFVFPMLAGVVPANLINDVTNALILQTEEDFHGHLATGLVGVPVIMEWAAKTNKPDFIYSMLKKKTYPGYLYMLENGATTTWEHWNGERSRIHNCYNGVGQWFYQAVGGIRAIDGEVAYREFLIHPQIPEGITWAKTQFNSPRGIIAVNWNLSADNIEMEIEVPVGSTAKLCRPKGTSAVKINHETVTSNDTIPLQSGKYFVEYNLNN